MAKEGHQGKSLKEISELYGIGQYDHHFLLCTGPDCCSEEDGQAAWLKLKDKIRALWPRMREAKMYRTKVGCLRMCQEGPTALCYPEGKWYRGVTADQVEGLVDHILSGDPAPHPLEFTHNPLPKK
jgi:(2Fe-2S) ferredoxin